MNFSPFIFVPSKQTKTLSILATSSESSTSTHPMPFPLPSLLHLSCSAFNRRGSLLGVGCNDGRGKRVVGGSAVLCNGMHMCACVRCVWYIYVRGAFLWWAQVTKHYFSFADADAPPFPPLRPPSPILFLQWLCGISILGRLQGCTLGMWKPSRASAGRGTAGGCCPLPWIGT